MEVIARFMAVLELFREATIELDQPECFGELTVRWAVPGSQVRGSGPAPDQPEDNAAGDDDRR
jgi:segregation and condensation protein A